MYELSEQELNLMLSILEQVPLAGSRNQVNALSAGAKLRGQLEILAGALPSANSKPMEEIKEKK